MLHLFLPRCAGKTSRLIAKAYAEGCDILVATRRMGDCVIDTAKHMGIPGPTWASFHRRRPRPYSRGFARTRRRPSP